MRAFSMSVDSASPRTTLHNFTVRTESGGDYVNSLQSFHSGFWGVAGLWSCPVGKSKSQTAGKLQEHSGAWIDGSSSAIFPAFHPEICQRWQPTLIGLEVRENLVARKVAWIFPLALSLLSHHAEHNIRQRRSRPENHALFSPYVAAS